MYKAHAERKRKESSKIYLEDCLSLYEVSKNDNDTLVFLIEIAECIASNALTDGDRSTLFNRIGLGFLLRILKTTGLPDDYPASLYQSIALGVLSSLCVDQDQVMISQPGMKDFLFEINDIVRIATEGTDEIDAAQRKLLEDCVDIVAHLSHTDSGIDLLKQSGTLPVLVKFVLSSNFVKTRSVLSSLSLAVGGLGDTMFLEQPDTFHQIMVLALSKLRESNDMKEKAEYAIILTSFLTGISTIEVSDSTSWVPDLTMAMKFLLPLKLNAEDGSALLFLMCAFVGSVGTQVLSRRVSGDAALLKMVVARMSVEVYVLLDGIDPDNALDRYPWLDKVYKLASDLVQYLAESGDQDSAETLDADVIVVVYRQLVGVSDTVMEFLASVAAQEINLPRNHVVVLISVRTLAAMLSEITEEPTPQLLELLPFFNLLCQTVEYSDEVKMEVKNATQTALENIKLMRMNPITEENDSDPTAIPTAQSSETGPCTSDSVTNGPSSSGHLPDVISKSSTSELTPCPPSLAKPKSAVLLMAAADSLKGLSLDSPRIKIAISSKDISEKCDSGGDRSESETKREPCPAQVQPRAATVTENGDFRHMNGDIQVETTAGQHSKSTENLASTHEENGSTNATSSHRKCSGVNLSRETIEKFRTFQKSLASLKDKPLPFNQRQLSLCQKAKRKQERVDAVQPWQLCPDDVLGFLLPTYTFLLEHEAALKIMSECDAFQTVINFLQKSLSQFLESESSLFPESMTMNALCVVEVVYSNSPSTAACLNCFQDLFELSVLSVPNLVSLPHPPTLICLKIIEVSLSAYKLQMRLHKRNSSLPHLKHSQPRFFKAVVEYLSAFYVLQQHRRHGLVLRIGKQHTDVWPLAEDYWCGSVAGLCTLLRDVEELQDVYVKVPVLREFLIFLHEMEASSDGGESVSVPEELQHLLKSMLTLIESAAQASDTLCQLIRQNRGLAVARKFKLSKLVRCLKV